MGHGGGNGSWEAESCKPRSIQKLRFENVISKETYLEPVAQVFRPFPVRLGGRDGLRESLVESAVMDLTAGTLGRGKNKQVCWRLSETGQLLLPRRLILAGEVCESLLQTLRPGFLLI